MNPKLNLKPLNPKPSKLDMVMVLKGSWDLEARIINKATKHKFTSLQLRYLKRYLLSPIVLEPENPFKTPLCKPSRNLSYYG